jgi:hypothetical protein
LEKVHDYISQNIIPLIKKKKLNSKVAITKMHARILMEMVADPFGTEQHNLETADLGD